MDEPTFCAIPLPFIFLFFSQIAKLWLAPISRSSIRFPSASGALHLSLVYIFFHTFLPDLMSKDLGLSVNALSRRLLAFLFLCNLMCQIPS